VSTIKYTDGVVWKTMQLWKEAGSDIKKRDNAITTASYTLSRISSDFMRAEYIKNLSKSFGISRKDLENRVKMHSEVAEAEVLEERMYKLPESVDPAFVDEWGFYELVEGKRRTGYYFDLGRDKKCFEVSNFVLRPLFHLYSPMKEWNKRMVEINNGYVSKTIEVQSSKMISVEAFSAELMAEGHYLFHGSRPHLVRLNDYWGDKFPMCYELTNLGWQKEGFFAYSDRIYNGELLPYNEYGIILHNQQHFYSPGANTKRSQRRADAGKFDADHQLKYSVPAVTWEEWANKMAIVYPEHYMTAIAVVCMALCRDMVLEFSNNFPLLYCYGERQSGKSEFALSIMNVFINDAKMFNLNSGTDAAFFTFIGRYVNCFVGLNEFDDKDIRPEWFQAIKGFFDNEGRKRNVDKHKMEEQPINCMAGLCGQYLSTRDDNSVVSRSILCQFLAKPNRSQEEMKNFQQLVDMQKRGLNGIMCDVLKKRFDTLNNGELKDLFDETLKELRTVVKNRELRWEDRVGRNYALLITMGKWAHSHWKMPYTITELQEYAMARMMDVVNIMHTTDVLMEWWNTLSMLADQGEIRQGWHYKIKTASGLPCRKDGKDIDLGADAPRTVVMIRLDYCARMVQKAMKAQQYTTVNKSNVAGYFKNREYWLGTRDGEWFEQKDPHTGKLKKSNTSVYVFDYEMLEKLGVYLNYDPDMVAHENDIVMPREAKDSKLPF
jgi:DNA primase